MNLQELREKFGESQAEKAIKKESQQEDAMSALRTLLEARGMNPAVAPLLQGAGLAQVLAEPKEVTQTRVVSQQLNEVSAQLSKLKDVNLSGDGLKESLTEEDLDEDDLSDIKRSEAELKKLTDQLRSLPATADTQQLGKTISQQAKLIDKAKKKATKDIRKRKVKEGIIQPERLGVDPSLPEAIRAFQQFDPFSSIR